MTDRAHNRPPRAECAPPRRRRPAGVALALQRAIGVEAAAFGSCTQHRHDTLRNGLHREATPTAPAGRQYNGPPKRCRHLIARITIAVLPRSHRRRSVSSRAHAYVRRARAYGLDAKQQLTALRVDPPRSTTPTRASRWRLDALASGRCRRAAMRSSACAWSRTSPDSPTTGHVPVTRSPQPRPRARAMVRLSPAQRRRHECGSAPAAPARRGDRGSSTPLSGTRRAVRCTLQAWCALLARVGRC